VAWALSDVKCAELSFNLLGVEYIAKGNDKKKKNYNVLV